MHSAPHGSAESHRGNFIWRMLGLAIMVSNIEASENIQIDATHCTTNKTPQLKIAECASYFNTSNIEQKHFHLLQKVEIKLVPATRCHLRTSSHFWYCGRYSHIHLAGPALVEIPQLLDFQDCQNIAETKIFNYEGKTITVYEHQMSYARFIVNGSLSYPNDVINGIDPACEGSGVYINGVFIPNTFSEKQIGIQAEPVELLQNEMGCYLGSHWIGTNCLDRNLRLGYDRIVTNNASEKSKKYFSHWRTVDIFNMSLFTFENGKQGSHKKLLLNPQISLALELQEEIHFQDLIPELSYFSTNIDNLAVWFTKSVKPYFPLIDIREKDNMLPLKILFSYQQYHKLIFTGQQCSHSHFLTESSVRLHRHQLVRTLGELEIILPCYNVKINVTLGENLPCFMNHLAVTFNNETMGISPFSRKLTRASNLMPMNCSENPIFLHLGQGKFIGNKGEGLTIIEVKNYFEGKMANPYTHSSINYNKSYDKLENIEELYLNQLAIDATTFEVKVKDSWFIETYHKVVNFLTASWYHLVLVIAAVITGIGAFVCILFIIYLLAYTKIHAYRETPETHELERINTHGEN